MSDRSIGEVSSAILDRALSTPVAHRPPCVPLRSARIAAGRPRCVLGPFDLRFEAAEVECVERSGCQIFFPRYELEIAASQPLEPYSPRRPSSQSPFECGGNDHLETLTVTPRRTF